MAQKMNFEVYITEVMNMLWKWQMNFVKIRGYEYEMNMQSVKMCEIMSGKFLSSSCFMTSGKSGLPKQG